MAHESKGLSKLAYSGCRGDEYVPYVPTTEVMPELTGYSIIMGVLFAILFAAANTYLGLKVGMTISAGIPGAILATGLLKGSSGATTSWKRTWSRRWPRWANPSPAASSSCFPR